MIVATAPTESDKLKASVEALRQKGPPYGYRFTPDSPEIWTNIDGKRVWVKDAKGIIGELGCPIEPLGVFIPEDTSRYYDAGTIRAR